MLTMILMNLLLISRMPTLVDDIQYLGNHAFIAGTRWMAWHRYHSGVVSLSLVRGRSVCHGAFGYGARLDLVNNVEWTELVADAGCLAIK